MLKKLVRDDPSLGFALKHYQHLGRTSGTAALQLNETPEPDITCLGNWGHTVFHKAYHCMFPLRGILAMQNLYVSPLIMLCCLC